MRTFLMSMQKDLFEALLNYTKTHEFRRRFSCLDENFQCGIYVSYPVKAVMAMAEFGPVIEGDIEAMVGLVRNDEYSSPKNVRNYFEGLHKGYALPLVKIKKLENTISLEELRAIIPNFMPPQSYFSIDTIKYQKIREVILNAT